MSHEGIRIVNAEQAARESARDRRRGYGGELPKLSISAVTPLKVRVKKTEGTGVEIDWHDGHQSAWSFAFLRDACPCATCHEEREHSGRLPGEPKPKDPNPLALYQAPARPLEVLPIGKYAVKFKWNDGHEGGIYSWDFLRRVCRCAICNAVGDTTNSPHEVQE
jgi:DUF971 family protein